MENTSGCPSTSADIFIRTTCPKKTAAIKKRLPPPSTNPQLRSLFSCNLSYVWDHLSRRSLFCNCALPRDHILVGFSGQWQVHDPALVQVLRSTGGLTVCQNPELSKFHRLPQCPSLRIQFQDRWPKMPILKQGRRVVAGRRVCEDATRPCSENDCIFDQQSM